MVRATQPSPRTDPHKIEQGMPESGLFSELRSVFGPGEQAFETVRVGFEPTEP